MKFFTLTHDVTVYNCCQLERKAQSTRKHQEKAALLLVSISSFLIPCYGGLTLAGHQEPSKATLSLPSSPGQERENIMKGSWVKIRTGRDHSPVTAMGKTDLAWGNYTNETD